MYRSCTEYSVFAVACCFFCSVILVCRAVLLVLKAAQPGIRVTRGLCSFRGKYINKG